MSDIAQQINDCKTLSQLDALRLAVVRDMENFEENQKLFIKRKNKIKRNGGVIR